MSYKADVSSASPSSVLLLVVSCSVETRITLEVQTTWPDAEINMQMVEKRLKKTDIDCFNSWLKSNVACTWCKNVDIWSLEKLTDRINELW